jgi:hypothetical protein
MKRSITLFIILAASALVAQNHIVAEVPVPALHNDRIMDHIVYLQSIFTRLQFDNKLAPDIQKQAGHIANQLWALRNKYEQGINIKQNIQALFNTFKQTGLFQEATLQATTKIISEVFQQLEALL